MDFIYFSVSFLWYTRLIDKETLMKRTHSSILRTLAVIAVLAAPLAMAAQDLAPISLPKPQITGGKPLMDALSARKTGREFAPDKLPPQVLSNLLWAAFGVNRAEMPGRTPAKPGRTAPSAMNLQEIDLYVAFPDGVYLYEPVPHRLVPVVAKDLRAMTNRNAAAGTAPLCFIFVEDQDKRPAAPAAKPPAGAPPAGAPPAAKPAAAAPRSTSGEVDCGFIGQNIYLVCASEGLNAWFYGTNREDLAKALNLRPGQKVLYGQAVGYPKK
jgi:nitroreductase